MSIKKPGGSDESSNPPQSKERASQPLGVSYAPTPLNPYELQISGLPYIGIARQKIHDIFIRNLNNLSEKPSQAVVDLLEVSINSALFRRFENNSGKAIPPDCDETTARLFSRACLGNASPDDLLNLLMLSPADLESIELAKQTHPFDWTATTDMEIVIGQAKKQYGMQEIVDSVRYYYTRSDDAIKPTAIIMIRKTDVSQLPTPKGRVTLTQRDSIVLDLDRCETRDVRKEFKAWLRSDDAKESIHGSRKTPYFGSEVTKFLETQLSTPLEYRSAALYPGVRSYYAHYESETADETDSMTDA